MLIKLVDQVLRSFLPLKIGAELLTGGGEGARGKRREVPFSKQEYITEFEHSHFVGPTST